MDELQFIKTLVGKEWRSKNLNTVFDDKFNAGKPPKQREVIESMSAYYPGKEVSLTVVPSIIVFPEYQMGDGQQHPKVEIPSRMTLTFKLKFGAGGNFGGKERLESAQFLVKGDYAISAPIWIQKDICLIDHIRLAEIQNNMIVMVHELIWSQQHFDDVSAQSGKTGFHDIQRWYCC